MCSNNISLYIHIPFCKKKCSYCDFASFPADDFIYKSYTNALCKEISSVFPDSSKTVSTIFIGGGTPTILPSILLEQIVNTLKNRFKLAENCEFTIEANPGTIDTKKLQTLNEIGITRLSIGLQSIHEIELKVLGRIHNYTDFLKSYNSALEIGFNNINVDLMFGIPEQKLKDFEQTLDTVLRNSPQHISAYSLIVEEGTPFYEMPLNLPDEDMERGMYEMVKQKMKENGYTHYEISNFAKPGFECRHNLVYWDCKEYIGLGLGAHSYYNSMRYHNTYDLTKYINGEQCRDDNILISKKDAISEFMFMGLRKIKGIKESDFALRFGTPIDSVFSEQINKLIGNGLILRDGDSIYLTERGIDVSNLVFEEFLL